MFRMEMTAHQRHFGINDEDEVYAFLWTHDDKLDFVFSLTRPVDCSETTPITFMVLDQIWEPIDDFDLRIDDDTIYACVPTGLRQFTSDSDEILIHHGCRGDDLFALINVLRQIFEGKKGLQVHTTSLEENSK